MTHRLFWACMSACLVALALCAGCHPQTVVESPPPQESVADTAIQAGTQAEFPRQATAYLEVQLPENLRQLLRQLSMDADIRQEFREIFLAHAMSTGKGSGVAVGQLPGGNATIVVTNRHVVARTDQPLVSFDEGKTLAKAKILYVDDQYDLAVLEVPGAFNTLPIQQTYHEPDEVVAMGFPALNDTGSFQATRGSISNACLSESILLKNGSNRCWIQHTAAIDPGSSGGPLLSSKNEVIGLNASFMSNRNDAFFAVPATAIKTAMEKADHIRSGRADTAWMMSSLKDSCHRFISEIASPNRRVEDVLMPAVSSELVVKSGLPAMSWVLERDSGNSAEFLQILATDPLKGLRLAVTIYLASFVALSDGIQNGERCENVHPGDNVLSVNAPVRIMVNMNDGDRAELSWRFENGAWRLVGFEL